ncbi:hypothetical protein MMC09_002950 [Bachmanniomyces sp. S44760]|nr:hypothetical protein [Bachmanniomyces sp. S44760]
MSDADLEEIRRARLAQLQQQKGASSSVEASSGSDQGKAQQEADARNSILSQILLPEAADRLGRIRLVKESRATMVEDRLIMLAKSGQLRSKITEDQLKELLGSLAEHEEKAAGGGKIVISRRKGGWDDDDELDDM